MKKFISGLIAAFLLSAGFVAVSAETAQAACKATSYTQCSKTATSVHHAKTVKKGKKPKAVVKIKTQGGSAKPKGFLYISYRGPGHVKKTIRVAYNGTATTVVGPKFRKKGTYWVRVVFKPTNNFSAPKTVRYSVKVK